MAKSFYAQVSENVAKYKKRMEATLRASAQDVADEVTRPVAKGGRMRVKTGFLRSSLMGSTSSMPAIAANARPDRDAADDSYRLNETQINLVIAGAQIGETIYLGLTASYAAHRERQDGFVALTAQQWPQFVQKNARRSIAAYR